MTSLIASYGVAICLRHAASLGSPVVVNGGTLSMVALVSESGVLAGTCDQSIGSLAGTGGAVNIDSGTVGKANTSTSYAGAVTGANGSIRKVGAGTLTLSGDLTYTGVTMVEGGTLALANTNSVATFAATVIAGTLQLTPLKTRVLDVDIASVFAGAKLDVTDNKLIVRSGSVG